MDLGWSAWADLPECFSGHFWPYPKGCANSKRIRMPNRTITPQIVDTSMFCQNFPPQLKNEVQRTAVLSTIDLMLGGETDLVVVHGSEGIGKTTLLAQFARAHPDQTISIFIRPSSRFGYDPNFLVSDMCSQIECLLRGTATTIWHRGPVRFVQIHLRPTEILYAGSTFFPSW